MAIEEHISSLLNKYLHDTCTHQEYEELLTYFGIDANEDNAKEILYHAIASDNVKAGVSEERIASVVKNAHSSILNRIHKPRPLLSRRVLPYAAAIMLFLSVSIGIYWYYQINNLPSPLISSVGNDVMPGGNRATLTLSDGSSIGLRSDQTGIVSGADLMYEDGTPIEATKTEYATMTTPNGGQYQITLPDGSKVWLNAESSLKYPMAFSDHERRVTLTGEAYFEVAHHAKQPFIVESNGQSVQVLGTQFNVNAYGNESSITTTLVQGAVKILNGVTGHSVTLAPGEQAVVRNSNVYTHKIDVTEFTAWKDGYFNFKATDLKTILRQIERWYDVEVDYSTVPDRKLYARIDRNKKLSSVLYMLESTSELKFQREGRRLRIE